MEWSDRGGQWESFASWFDADEITQISWCIITEEIVMDLIVQ